MQLDAVSIGCIDTTTKVGHDVGSGVNGAPPHGHRGQAATGDGQPHRIRVVGNAATHRRDGDHSAALRDGVPPLDHR